jgi:hypothetical protein
MRTAVSECGPVGPEIEISGGAYTLCLVRAVYLTYVQTVFRLAVAGIAGKTVFGPQ